MGTEILKGEPVRTFRKERKFLLDIRNEKYSFEQIFDMVNIYEKEFLYAKENSPLPVLPDIDKINELVIDINMRAIK